MSCPKCCNSSYVDKDTLYYHLSCEKMMPHYNVWFHHGKKHGTTSTDENIVETRNGDEDHDDIGDDMSGMLRDAFGVPIASGENIDGGEDMDGSDQEANDIFNDDATKFYKLTESMKNALNPRCKSHTILSFIIKRWHIKCISGWSNKSFSMLLDLLREAYPESILPENFTQSKKIISDLGLDYNKIDACPNDCMLYWKDSAKEQSCLVCETSRWKNPNDGVNKKSPAKVLCHFPLKPRLQRLFMTSKVAKDMRWHDEERTKDRLLRHPADSEAWKHFDHMNPTFAADSRNIKLGLASDSFNPFRTMIISHSTWPVIVIPYNLPPWLCMKQANVILSVLIPGPCGPGKDIDVCMRPLVDELKELWVEGLDTYDSFENGVFKLRASLLWTISDFPGYAMLSGWSTKGKLACPLCHKHTCSKYLKHGKKLCCMGHRRFLPSDHRFRKLKNSFDGNIEEPSAPTQLTGKDIFEKLKDIPNIFGKMPVDSDDSRKKKARTLPSHPMPHNWKKRSILFELPYWSDGSIILPHNLDPMHIEKNVCDNALGTLLNLNGKSKDSLKARLDFVEMGIRSDLHPELREGNKMYIPSASYSMDKPRKEMFCGVLKNVRTPSGYSSNFTRCIKVKECKISGLKSHDSHVILQQFLPLAVRKTLPKNVSSLIVELSTYFRDLCSKVGRQQDFRQLAKRIPLIISKLEKIFPPSWFDVMVHLPIHLANEAAGSFGWTSPLSMDISH